jgi:hypothetical protein
VDGDGQPPVTRNQQSRITFMSVIGVTGHRTLLDPAAVSGGIGTAFDHIEA